jgi:hypothetical protein
MSRRHEHQPRMAYVMAATAVLASQTAFAQPITPPLSGITSRNDFQTQVEAKRHCGGRRVVWVIASERVYYVKGDAQYGRKAPGAYMCEDEAKGDGNRRAARGRQP